MKLLDIVTAPWAVIPAKLTEMAAVYETHLRGDKIRLEGPLAAIAKPPSAERQPYANMDGVAVINIDGVLTKRASWLSSVCGMTSTEMVGADLQAALADPAVQSILLRIDSPGGMVDGTQTLADQVRAARDIKPVVALADGMMASAAYWIGSAASQVYITDATTAVGSIGVVTTHVDVSAQEAQAGRKTTEITAGKYKRISSQYGPLTEEGKATIRPKWITSIPFSSIKSQKTGGPRLGPSWIAWPKAASSWVSRQSTQGLWTVFPHSPRSSPA